MKNSNEIKIKIKMKMKINIWKEEDGCDHKKSSTVSKLILDNPTTKTIVFTKDHTHFTH